MNQQQPQFIYNVSCSQPQSHFFEVSLTISNWHKNYLDLQMPVWTPGSYLVREYSRHLQEFKVLNQDQNKNLSWQKISKNHWQIDTKNINNCEIKYKIYANDLTVRTNHLDGTHGFFTGAALFFNLPQCPNSSFTIKIIPPQSHWQVTTALPPIPEQENTFLAENFDALVDSPFEIGTQKIIDFQVLNKNHQWVIWGEGNIDFNQVITDTEKIIKTEASLFGELPYPNYFFLLHLSASGFGGLEHKNCCVLNYPRFGFQKKEKYNRFMQLVAHEFFHLWNVKRIRPQALENFDYNQENYTDCLWFCEGTTSYYDMILPLRAGIYNRQTFLEILSKDISRYLSIEGRKIQPLNESSFDAWIKLYRRDEYSNNCQISYYLKGELVSLILDLLIRKNTDNQNCLDDVMRRMWQKFGKEEIGYSATELKQEITEVAQEDLGELFHLCLDKTEELPLREYLEFFGLRLEAKIDQDAPPYLGITLEKQDCREKITFVDANSPAGKAGIDAGDELLAIDDFQVGNETLSERLTNYQAGDKIKVTIFHHEMLQNVELVLANPQPSGYQLKVQKNLNPTVKERLEKWLYVG